MKQRQSTYLVIKSMILLALLSMSYQKQEGQILHRSIHDEFMRGKAVIPINIGSRQLQAQQEFRPYRLHFDWTTVDAWLPQQPRDQQPALQNKINFMKGVFQTVKGYFTDRYQVLSRPTMTLPKVACHGEFAADEFYNTPIEQDLVVAIKPMNESSGFFAAAGACFMDRDTGRPIFGTIFLNFLHINPSDVNRYYIPGVFIHETMHIMGFSGGFMQRQGLIGDVQIGGSTRAAVTSKGVVEYAKQYFNCPEIEGVPVENNGGGGSAGSHWEKTMFPAEVMNPQVASPARISLFTVKLFEDLGWYKGINAHQEYNYLKGDGCHTIKGGECNSNKSDEFCANGDFGRDHCYPNKLGKARCGGSGFMAGCQLQMPRHNAFCLVENDSNHKNFNFESYGPHSRCVMADQGNNRFQAACLRMRCKNNQVEIQFGGEVFTCPSAGNHPVALQAYNGTVECPPASQMCGEVLDIRCPMDCYGQGLCMRNGTCQCLGGFSGDDCNQGLPKEQDPFVKDFDIRNQGNGDGDGGNGDGDGGNGDGDDDSGNGDGDDDSGDGDGDDDNEDDDENDDGSDDDSDDDDEKKEEEDEDDGQNRPKSPKALELEVKIEREQQFQDFWRNRIKESEFRVKRFNLCINSANTRQASRCQRQVDIHTARKADAETRVADFDTKINDLETELAAELTDKQKSERGREQDVHDKDRKIEILDKIILFMSGRLELFERKQERRLRRIEVWNKIIEQRPGCPRLIARLRSLIARAEGFVQTGKALIEMTGEEIDKAEEERTMLGIVSEVPEDAKHEVEEEIEFQRDHNTGWDYGITGDAQIIPTQDLIPMTWN